jgi:heme exporter protein A
MAVFAGTGLTCARSNRVVFAALSFTLEDGGALILAGPNGSGKSSLLRLMAGLIHPRRGRLAWNGLAVDDDPAAHAARLAFLGHLDGVKPALTVLENLAFWAAFDGVADPAGASLKALDRMGIQRLAEVPGRILSAGQRRRVGLARVLVRDIPLWLLDEPATGLDDAGVARLEAAIEEHRAAGGMVALSTHAPLALDDACDLSPGDFAPVWSGEEAE